ncbi:MAG: Ger(x)C family spore germination protein [Clostridia bacterium]|nr:Ger(x)C family spore germination protein [Clostridia bacterium]
MNKQKILNIILGVSAVIFILGLIDFKSPIATPGDIEKNFFILAVAIDKSEKDPQNYKLTIISEKFGESGSSGSSGQSKSADIASSEGKTILEAVRNFNSFHSKKLFWGHIKYIIVNEEIAKKNILNVLDFFVRDHELRFDTSVLISKDTSAKSILEAGEKNKEFIPDTLKSIMGNINRISISKKMTLSDVMEGFDDRYSDQCIPYVKIVQNEGNSGEGNSGEGKDSKGEQSNSSKEHIDIVVDGVAVFNNEKLIGYLSQNMSRGVNWVNNEVDSSTIIVKDKFDSYVSLEVINASSSIKIALNNNVPEATIAIKFVTNFDEQMSQKDIYHEEILGDITERQTELVKKEIENVVEYAQKNDIDIFNISNKVFHKYPLKWEKIKDNWDEIFKTMKINVKVESNINRSYHVRQGIRNEGGGK